jgi:hypothetical protein
VGTGYTHRAGFSDNSFGKELWAQGWRERNLDSREI